MKKPIVAVTMGDPGGIGPEVIARSLTDPEKFSGALLLLIGATSVFEFLEEELHLRLPLNPIPTLARDFLREDSVNFLDVTEEAEWLLKAVDKTVIARTEGPKPSQRSRSLSRAEGLLRFARNDARDPAPHDGGESETLFEIGRVSKINAAMALASLKAGAYQGATGLIDALVTGPVHKEAIRLLEPKFSGHTEYLAKVARVKEFAMMFLKEEAPGSPPLRITLVTLHIPLKKVSRIITSEMILEKIRLTDEFLKTRLRIAKPRLAVSALNPHGGEAGEEEREVIEPAMERARKEKRQVFGPLSGDTVFYEAYQGAYDAVIAMYHDQALAPFKLVAFETGVNVTLGLPYIRTSPDHGTAFNIAYQGKANPKSMEEALKAALNLFRI